MGTVHLVGKPDGWARIPDEQDAGRVGFGDWLRRAREARGLTLDSLTDATRIPRRHLEAIEHDDFSLLPEFYQRAEIRAIARAVGVDEQLALQRLQSAVAPPVQPHPDSAQPVPDRRFSIRYGALALGVAAVLLAALLGRGLSDPASETAAAATTATALVQAPPPSGEVSASDGVAAPVDLVPAPPPPASDAELVVTTQPPGARVTVNGIGWGTSPVAIKYLQPGDKRIRVSKDGFGSAERVLVLDEGRRQTVDIPLTAAP